MIWLPGVGEFPMSLSIPRGGLSSIGVKAMGEGSRVLYDSGIGCLIGVRGPYGNSFQLDRSMKKVLLVGGGTGMVPMVALARKVSRSRSTRAKMVIAAKTKAELPYLSASKKYLGEKNVYPVTDDGSFGFGGLAHEKVEKMLGEENFDQVFSCGPEMMMAAVQRVARKRRISVQFSLERIMKCGIGICGSCTIGDIVLCKDGAVLDSSGLERVKSEFGSYHRNKAGSLVRF